MPRLHPRPRPLGAATILHPPLPHLCHRHWPEEKTLAHPNPNTVEKEKKVGSAVELLPSDTNVTERPKHPPPDHPTEAATILIPPLPHLCHHHWLGERAMVQPQTHSVWKGKKKENIAGLQPSDGIADKHPHHHHHASGSPKKDKSTRAGN
ncbi:zinc finger SWIM domain-containing protein 1 [Striga asiatica]|uniref:Zinc finger SWIM domain-containing protein 1 n=1 Tax=Striga asiatica TaxID=4170 RepID=A0A5A7QZB1_STRAF|nr:zinc finger SWIM domain-containing protein 1 [Striga asiatica]